MLTKPLMGLKLVDRAILSPFFILNLALVCREEEYPAPLFGKEGLGEISQGRLTD